MEKNEMQINSIINQTRNKLMNFKYSKSKISIFSKFNSSKNLFLQNKGETSVNFRRNKKSIYSNRSSEDMQNKSEDFIISTNSISKRKINHVKFDTNYIRRISTKNNSKTNEIIKNENILNGLNISQIRESKIDFINYQFLLGQKNYFKKIFQHYDFNFPKYKTKRKFPYLNQNSKKSYDENKLKKSSFEQDELNSNSIKDEIKNFTVSSYINRNNHNNNNNEIKFNKYNAPDIKKLNELLFEYSKRKNNKNNNVIEKEKIIDDNYNEYLKGISSTLSNKSKSEVKRLSRQNHKNKIKNLKNYLLLYDKSDIYQNIKRINNNRSSTMIKQNNKFFFNRSQSLKNINKSVSIENPLLRKKIKLKKIVL